MERFGFNRNWTFWNAKYENVKQKVHLPHDAMQTEKRLPGIKGGTASGFFPGGKYVYTKEFFGDIQFANKVVLLEFEGVYQKSTVYLNGAEVGGHIYGYTQFVVELTGKLKIGELNEIKVLVDNTQTPNSRWYTGSGIYRDVSLLVGESAYIKPYGVRVRTVSYAPAVLHVEVDASETKDVQAHTVIRDGETIVAFADGFAFDITVPNAKLWNADAPNLYRIEVALQQDGKIIDTVTEQVGIRKLEWSVDGGLLVNGKSVKLRGGCIHHDNGPLGACEFKKVAYRRIRILKEAGYNAIRYSHQPASKAILDACDTLGMYVMDETFDIWTVAKSDYDYSLYFEQEWANDVTAMIQKDYNHPSVVLYSIGNEIMGLNSRKGGIINNNLAELCRKLDPTRPVTHAISGLMCITKAKDDQASPLANKVSANDIVDPYREEKDGKAKGSLLVNMMVTLLPAITKALVKPDKMKKNAKSVMDALDIVGFNYADHISESLHAIDPNRILLNTETFPKNIGQNWPVVERNPYLLGDFMWTAWDYLGETGIGLVEYGKKRGAFSKPYPCLGAGIGSIDLTGFIEAQGYYASVVWGKYRKPYIGVRPVNQTGKPYFMGQWRGTDVRNSWSWEGQEGKKAEIEVFSIGDKVELILNGKSLGKKPLLLCKACFETVYTAGKLEAISYDAEGIEVARSELISAQKETVLTVVPEEHTIKADGEDLAFISFSITDAKGTVKMLNDMVVTIAVAGAGSLAGVGSGNPVTTENFTDSCYTTYYGRGLAIIRSNSEQGAIAVTFSAEGIEAKTIELRAE